MSGVTRAIALTAACLGFAAPRAAAQTPPAGRLLDVPYVAQSADLCGGAALAMVLRYWGDRSAVAEDFAHLVDPERGGITTGRLVGAAESRGWLALPASGVSPSDVRAHVEAGRPPMALIEGRPGVLHYVVVVAWTDEAVVVHDPARAPFTTMAPEEFARRWSVTDEWMLVVLPAPGSEPQVDEGADRTGASSDETSPADHGSRTARTPCDDLLTRGVAAAQAGTLDDAEALLRRATHACPDASAPWRELAGVSFLRQDWPAAGRHAEAAVALDSGDTHAWRILAAARYRAADAGGALDAMAAAGESRIDLVEVDGALRTPQPVVIETAGLVSGTRLDASAFARSRRRLDALPAASRSRLSYRPSAADGVTVEAAIAERDAYPRTWTSWAGIGAAALVTDTVRVDAASLTGSGERLSLAWRWNDRRPLVAFRLATPAPSGLPGIAVIEAEWRTDTWASRSAAGAVVPRARRRVSFGLSDWMTGTWRWRTVAAADRFDGRSMGSIGGGLEWRRLDDRAAWSVEGDVWAGGAGAAFGAWAVDGAWRSQVRDARGAWSARAGVTGTSPRAPIDVQPGAGTGQVRSALLRAHPLLDADVVTGRTIGRGVAHASVEYARRLLSHPLAGVSAIGFVDAAHIRARGAGRGALTHVDVGAGLRVDAPGLDGTVDLSLAWGTRDGRVAASAVLRAPWPGR